VGNERKFDPTILCEGTEGYCCKLISAMKIMTVVEERSPGKISCQQPR